MSAALPHRLRSVGRQNRLDGGHVIEPIVGGLVASVLVYLAVAALFSPIAGVIAVLVLGAVGTAALVGMHLLAAR